MSIHSKISTLVQLANIDGEFAKEERSLIYKIGKMHNVSEEEIDGLIAEPKPLPPISTMSEDDKFEYLFYLVQLVKSDKKIFLSEIKFCENIAEKVGYKKGVLSYLISKIYSDPQVSSDMKSIKKEVRKYQK